MKTIIGAVCTGLALLALTPAQAWANPQHERMRRCNAEAKEQTLKGEERKAFMSSCLRGRHDAGAAKDALAAAPAESVADKAGAAVNVAAATNAAAAAAGVAPPIVAPAVAAPAAIAPAAAASASTPSAALVAAAPGAGDDKARAKACNQSATEQSLRGAKRKTFITECLKG